VQKKDAERSVMPDLEIDIIYEGKPDKPFGRLRLKTKTTSMENVCFSSDIQGACSLEK
jgi:hypothetical protein